MARAAAFKRCNAASTMYSHEVDDDDLVVPGDGEEDVWDVKVQNHCGSRLVMTEANWLRRLWEALSDVLLFYTGTIFLYRICFVEFHVEDPIVEDHRWLVFDEIVNALFIIDLIIRFFFSYRLVGGREVDSIPLIAKRYLSGFFLVNLVACLPSGFVALLIGAPESSAGANRSLRIARLQRAWRLCRLVRLQRVAAVISQHAKSPSWRSMNRVRSLRVINFGIGLLYVVHVLSCGWYLCAAFHPDLQETWLARRPVDSAGAVSLLSRPPLEQWVHSMYFILTVFSTVGFGDMAPGTQAEIVYVGFVMIIGAVVHSSLIGEVIDAVKGESAVDAHVYEQCRLVEDFGKHVDLDMDTQKRMRAWISAHARGWLTPRYDRHEVKQLFLEKGMPWSLLEQLQGGLFKGRLQSNSIFRFSTPEPIPPRLHLSFALAAHQFRCHGGDIIYQMNDYPFHLYLVLQGTFGHVALPAAEGGMDKNCATNHMDGHTRTSLELEDLLVQPMEVVKMAWKGKRSGTTKSLSKTRGLSTQALSDSGGEDVRKCDELFPYQTVSFDGYFGDVEIIRGCPRRSSVRCESSMGFLLVVRREDFLAIFEEFPQYRASWQSAATRREVMRHRLLGKHSRKISCRQLSACRIQRFYRWGVRGWHRGHRLDSPSSAKFSAPSPEKAKDPAPKSPPAPVASERSALGPPSPVSPEPGPWQSCQECAQLRGELSAVRGDIEALRQVILTRLPEIRPTSPLSPQDGRQLSI